MSTPYSIATQNNNKCPHGFPIGSCPICSGAMGMPKDKNKARRPGEMTYNECMTAWIKMQAQKDAKIQEKIEKANLIHKNNIETKIQEELHKLQKKIANIEQQLENLNNILKIPAKILLNIAIKPFIKIISKIPIIIENIKTTINSLMKMINSASEKISSLLGEIKNFIKDKILKKFKKTIKTILSLFCENESFDEERKNIEKTKLETIKNIISTIFNKKDKDKEDKLDENKI